jgi:signal transduction histidine kinase
MPLEVSDPASLGRHVLNVGIVAAVLSLPPLTRATGISAPLVVAIIAVHLIWTVAVLLVMRPPMGRSPARFHFTLAGSVLINTAIVVAFPALGGEPRTPLWMLAVMYACFNGSTQEIEPSVGILAIHVGMPPLAIPLLLAHGAPQGWSIAAPLLCSAVSAVGYNHLAQTSAGSRETRRDNERAMAALRTKLDDDEGIRLARDLHDSLGSSLAIVGLYGDLIERHAERPEELRAISALVRQASNEGASELAALLRTITPESADVDCVAATIADHGRHAALSSGTAMVVTVRAGGHLQLDGTVRLALLRVVQESMHNAIEHGAAKRVTVSFAAEPASVSVEIADDGRGFSATDAPVGRGVTGMCDRASELGGTFAVTTSPGEGTRIVVTLPRARPAA